MSQYIILGSFGITEFENLCLTVVTHKRRVCIPFSSRTKCLLHCLFKRSFTYRGLKQFISARSLDS
jgi:hypothetical protein